MVIYNKKQNNLNLTISRSLTRCLVFIFAATMLVYVLYMFEDGNNIQFLETADISSVFKHNFTYAINTSQCRIPDSNPYSPDIIDFIKVEKYFKCSKQDLLTYIDKSNGIVVLNVNQSLLKKYNFLQVKCCYSNITRVDFKKHVDNTIKLTPCLPFHNSVELKVPQVKVKCSTLLGEIYANVHATTFPVPETNRTNSKNQKFSILLFGIDSMSRANLKRTMPNTFDYVEKNFINLKGYNKIGDNTFPNLMATLTGYSEDQLSQFCNRTVKMNNCRFIWDKFKKSKYITAYAEDECSISTFNYDRPGFSDQPTDYYYHPYFIASESFLPTTHREQMTYCTGPEILGERVLNIIKDFGITHKQVPYFGVFWSNSYSHDSVNMPRVMDNAIYKLLSNPEFVSSLKYTILIFFSDHGFRFGDIRYTHTGWLEERLPFIYLGIPEKFKQLHPEAYKNLLINTARLTTPYDLFNTFEDILSFGNTSYVRTWSAGCAKCHSLFEEVAENRTCEDAAIRKHYCTCKGHSYINPNHPTVKQIAVFMIDKINKLIQSFSEGYLCSEYSLKTVKTAGISEPYLNENSEIANYFLIMIETRPTAIFEATVESTIDTLDSFEFRLLGDISRLDQYQPVTKCITRNGSLKKYCYCESTFGRLKKFGHLFR